MPKRSSLFPTMATVNRIKFQCYFCTKGFSHLSNFHTHLATHTKEAPFMCKVCTPKRRQYKYKATLLRHYKKYHRNLYEEEIIKIKTHRKRQTNSRISHNCYFCGATFKKQSKLFIHLTSHTREFQYNCKFIPCTTRRQHRSELQSHQKFCYFNPNRQLRERNLSCYFCGQKYTARACLTNHVRRHTGEKPYECTACPQRFKTNNQRQTHANRCHNLSKRYSCNFCDAEKISERELNLHIRTKHTKDHELQKCYFCLKKFRAIAPRHMAFHTGEKLFRCKHCPAFFQEASTFFLHCLKHIDTPEYFKAESFVSQSKLSWCYFCSKRFLNSGNLHCHIKKHTGEEYYECGRCGALRFTRKRDANCCRKRPP